MLTAQIEGRDIDGTANSDAIAKRLAALTAIATSPKVNRFASLRKYSSVTSMTPGQLPLLPAIPDVS